MAWIEQLYQWTTHHMFCMFHALTGIYCPGCGGTRSVYYLLTGHPLLSLRYHPITLYTITGISYVCIRLLLDHVAARQAAQRKTSQKAFGRHKKYHPSPAWLWVALAVILVNWFVKNLFLLAWGIDLLSPVFTS